MARSETATELRRLRQMLDRTNRRIAMMDIPGKVKASETDREKRTVRLVIGTAKDGTEVLGPNARWQEATAGRMRIHSEPDDGEQMMLRSASGTVGMASLAYPATYDNDHEAPSKEENISVFDRGTGARIELGDGKMKFIGPVEIEGTVKVTGASIAHNGREIGDTHKHEDVTAGPDLTGPPQA